MPEDRRGGRVVHPYATRTSKIHRIAARTGQTGRNAPPARHIGGGRAARVRKTVLGLLVVVLLGGAGWAGATRLTRGVDSTTGSPPTTADATAPGSPSPDSTSSAEPSTSESSSTSAQRSVTQRGNGKFTVLKVPGKDSSRSGKTIHYTVEVEGGLKDVKAATFAKDVRATLRDSRGWEPVDKVHFVNVSPAQNRKGADVDIRVTLASPATTDELCAPIQTNGQFSCWNGERSVINLRRWLLGADSYAGDLEGFRTFLINHGVGHGLGHGHVECDGPGERAPIMLQQTFGLDGCTKWPYPKRS